MGTKTYNPDSNWDKVVYMISGEGKSGNRTFPSANLADNTLETRYNYTSGNGPYIYTNKHLPWATTSLYGEGGTAAILTTPDTSGLISAAGAFTFEGWQARGVDTNALSGVLVKRPNSFEFGTDYIPSTGGLAGQSRLYFSYYDGAVWNTIYSPNNTINDANFHYLVAERTASGVVRLYCDGVKVAKAVVPTIANDTAQSVWMFCTPAGHGSGMYFDDLRLSVGIARYANDAGHVTPGSRLPKGSSTTGDPYWANVITYHRWFYGADVNRYADCSPWGMNSDNRDNWVGTDYSVTKFGPSLGQTRGGGFQASAFAIAPNSPNWNLRNKDFTIETWVNPLDSNANGGICGSWVTSGNQRQWAFVLAGGRPTFWASPDGVTTQTITPSAGVIPINTWAFVVVEKFGNRVSIYMDGVMVASGDISPLFDTGSSPACMIRGYDGGNAFRGYSAHLRITSGIARYNDQGVLPAPPTGMFPAYGMQYGASNVLLDENGYPTRSEDNSFWLEG